MKYSIVLFAIVLSSLVSGCGTTANVATDRASISAPALPASMDDWSRSNKRAVLTQHLDEALVRLSEAETDEERDRALGEIELIQKLDERVLEEPATEAPAIQPAAAPTSSAQPRYRLRIYSADGRLLKDVPTRGPSVPFKNGALRYEVVRAR